MTNNLNGNGGECCGGYPNRVLRVGIIGCGEIVQVAHIPNLNHMSDKFETTYLCDVSKNTLSHCAAKVASRRTQITQNAEELCASNEVDVVLIASANGFHVRHATMALQYNKYCLLEKPAALNHRDIDALIEAESKSRGKIFVGYMRRYASAFLEAIEEVGGMGQIQYARVRDIIGPNATFVQQSGTFPKRFSDIAQKDMEDSSNRENEAIQQALQMEFGVECTPASKLMFQLLCGLGTHDLSAMRELLGMPNSCIGASLAPHGIWTALFQYDKFPLTYESGINGIPDFEACIEVFSSDKSVKVDYNTPYVKGLPVTLTVREKVEGRPGSCSDGFHVRVLRRTYEDPYTLEFEAFYHCVVNDVTPKTTIADARQDIDLIAMIMKAGENNYVVQ